NLVSDALECGARQVTSCSASRDPEDGAARVRVPVWRPQPYECRHKIDPTVVRHGFGKCFDFLRLTNQAKAVTQPLYDRATDEYAAFKSIFGGVIDSPSYSGHELVGRWHGPDARILEHEAPRTVRILSHALGDALLAEERRLLISGNS